MNTIVIVQVRVVWWQIEWIVILVVTVFIVGVRWGISINMWVIVIVKAIYIWAISRIICAHLSISEGIKFPEDLRSFLICLWLTILCTLPRTTYPFQIISWVKTVTVSFTFHAIGFRACPITTILKRARTLRISAALLSFYVTRQEEYKYCA